MNLSLIDWAYSPPRDYGGAVARRHPWGHPPRGCARSPRREKGRIGAESVR